MALLMAKASGNLTASTTWGVVDSTSHLNAENATEHVVTTAYSGTRSAAFTPGAIEIDGIAVKLSERLGTTGTMSVQLELDSDNSAVAGTEVTINVADLPAALETDLNGGWILFKLSAPVTLLAATAYQVAAKTSSATQVELWKDATSQNISRALRTTTEQAPVAGDDMIITGEKTGAGAETVLTVTMNETATTDYGTNGTSLVTPGMAICDGGILRYGATAATNYYFKLSSQMIVYSGGELDIGTVATPIPRDSTAVLEFDPAADGDRVLTIRTGGTFIAQGLSRTSGKNVVSCKLNTDEAAAQTTLGVDTDTGWLNGDEIVIASTTRTGSQTEKRTLSANANASDMTVSSGLTNAHSGTSPTQAEVILLTRNVKIRSATSTIVTAIMCEEGAVVDLDWVEMYYLGNAGSGQRGLELDTTTGSVNVDYCSIHDVEDEGIYCDNTTQVSTNIFINNTVLYNCNATEISNSATIRMGGSMSVTNCILLLCYGGSADGVVAIVHAASSQYSNVIFTGNTIQPAGTNAAFNIDAGISNGDITGFVFQNNVIHSGGGNGIGISSLSVTPSITFANPLLFENTKIYRMTGSGISISQATAAKKISFATLELFGNTTNNIIVTGNNTLLYLDTATLSGDSTFATTNGINVQAYTFVYVSNSTLGVASGIKVAHTNDINVSTTLLYAGVLLHNTTCASTVELTGQSNMGDVPELNLIRIGSQKHDQTAATHRSWVKNGMISTDATAGLFRTATPSERLTPNSASLKLYSGIKKVAVASGATVTISCYVRESEAGDGAAYNGARARLILKKNPAAGIASDTVIDTATAASDGAFEQLTGTTPSVSDDAVLEFIVDVDGTTGWVNVDDWSAS